MVYTSRHYGTFIIIFRFFHKIGQKLSFLSQIAYNSKQDNESCLKNIKIFFYTNSKNVPKWYLIKGEDIRT